VTPPRLIGLVGYAGTGKDTVRQLLESEHGFVGLAFADPIRQMLRALFSENGIDEKYMDDRAFKEATIEDLLTEQPLSYRHMAQTLGTEWGRNLSPDFWLQIAGAFIADQRRRGERRFVVSDVRFVNEAQWIKDAGGELWHIHRPSASPVRAHASEAEIALIEVDRVVNNSGSIDDLWTRVDDVMAGVAA
jgi:hypothetical protein